MRDFLTDLLGALCRFAMLAMAMWLTAPFIPL